MSYWDINSFLAEEEKVEFSINNYDSLYIDFIDPTKDGVISKGQTITTPIWLLDTLAEYLQISDIDIKVSLPQDFHKSQESRIDSFRSIDRNSTIEQVRLKGDLPYFYQIYVALKKVTKQDSSKRSLESLSSFLQERGKLIMSRANGIFEQAKADPITNNYVKFQSDIYKMTRKKALQFHHWRTA